MEGKRVAHTAKIFDLDSSRIHRVVQEEAEELGHKGIVHMEKVGLVVVDRMLERTCYFVRTLGWIELVARFAMMHCIEHSEVGVYTEQHSLRHSWYTAAGPEGQEVEGQD
jgi:hypothetical protein